MWSNFKWLSRSMKYLRINHAFRKAYQKADLQILYKFDFYHLSFQIWVSAYSIWTPIFVVQNEDRMTLLFFIYFWMAAYFYQSIGTTKLSWVIVSVQRYWTEIARVLGVRTQVFQGILSNGWLNSTAFHFLYFEIIYIKAKCIIYF